MDYLGQPKKAKKPKFEYKIKAQCMSGILHDLELSSAERLVGVLILDHLNCNTGLCCPKNKDVAREADVTERYVRICIATLARRGWLRREKQHFRFRGINFEGPLFDVVDAKIDARIVKLLLLHEHADDESVAVDDVIEALRMFKARKSAPIEVRVAATLSSVTAVEDVLSEFERGFAAKEAASSVTTAKKSSEPRRAPGQVFTPEEHRRIFGDRK
jgi:hypothetical protein